MKLIIVGIAISFLGAALLITAQDKKETYPGKPYRDARVSQTPQVIPGRLVCAYYDVGGEGIAYHDTSGVNEGSGKLNPADGSYLNEFRMKEGVDISYTKSWDFTAGNLVAPESLDMLYVGWTEPGEWLNYTIKVKKTGLYTVDFFYSAAVEASISLSVNGEDTTGSLVVPTTENPHQWNRINNFTEIYFKKGNHILTLHTKEKGLMNYMWFSFTLKQ
ncbi:carbohydrate-binding protein [Bacteroides sp. 51]|uniref:carbohydrate-binding protein n=1 Tax=Bacteroides sp. 51 TaxID=2302938 RepID=UPI0013D4DA6A|nr:carbohydrate-binding protein [Bacteroides sp. 51]NDV82555.1 hypothetical protein [Bacteroides sp. 51]